MPTQAVPLNMTNLVPSTNQNVYRYTFPGSAYFRDASLSVKSISIFYSWQNINSTYGNNTLSIIFPTGATTATLSITIPNGTYSVSDLNSYLQSQMIANNYYLIDSTGNYVYYIELVENSVRYTIQLNEFSVPTSLPAGWTNPGWTLPTTAYTPQFVVPSTTIQTLLGFAAGTYPAAQQTSTYSTISTTTPQFNPVSAIMVGCNLINNLLSNPRTIIDTFTQGTTAVGSTITSIDYEYPWFPIVDGNYSSIDITFYDQNFNNLQIVDPNLNIFLLIKTP